MSDTTINFTLLGALDLDRQLTKLGRAVGNKRFQVRTLLAGAEPMRRMMSDLAPRSRRARQRHLADNIFAGVDDREPPIHPDDVTVSVGPAGGKSGNDFFFAGFIEYGTSRYPAHPFMRPAFDAMSETSLRVIRERVWEEITKQVQSMNGSVGSGT